MCPESNRREPASTRDLTRLSRACRTGRSEIASLTKRTRSACPQYGVRHDAVKSTRGRRRPVKSYRLWIVAPVLALFSGAAGANEELIKLSKDPNQWVMPAGDYANTRYSALNQINKENAKNLRPLWTFSTGVLRGHEGGPLVIGDIMYITCPFPNTVFALDLNKNGQILWKYEPKQDPTVIPVMCCDTVNRGVAYGDGKIFLHQADTTLVGARRQDRQRSVERQERRSEEGRDRNERAR